MGNGVDEPLVAQVGDGLADGVAAGAGEVLEFFLGGDRLAGAEFAAPDGVLEDAGDLEVDECVAAPGHALLEVQHPQSVEGPGRARTAGHVPERSGTC
jgi:hypothetical protein